VKVAGQAVGVTDKGIAPLGAGLPTAALNAILSQAGITITTVAPTITKTGTNATIDVVGLEVTITAPNPTPSIPTLVTKIILGESRAFAFATPGTPVVTTPATGGTSAPEAITSGPIEVPPPVTVAPAPVTTTPPTTSAPQIAAPAPAATGLRLVTVRKRPSMLLWAYLIWQVLIIGNAAVIVWWRRAAAVTP